MKKFLLFILVIILITIIAVWFWYSLENKKESEFYSKLSQQADEFCKHVKISTHGIDKATCKAIDFVRTNPDLIDQKYCEKTDLTPEHGSKGTKKGNIVICKNEIAANAKDISMCTIGDLPSEISNYESCLFRITIQNKNPDSCRIYSSNIEKENECYESMASKLSDIKICEKIEDSIYKSRCYYGYYFMIEGNLQNLDMSICSNISNDYYRSLCYIQFAIRYRNQALCEKTGPGYAREYSSWYDDGLPLNLRQYCLEVSNPYFGIQ